MTVITRVTLEEGSEPARDEAMRERISTAEEAEGFVAAQILIPLDSLNDRIILGVWETRGAWETWHNNPAFQDTRDRLTEIGADEGSTSWHETIYDRRRR